MSGCIGTLPYMAPEVIRCEPYNEKVDIYSFSIILWRLLTGEMPYSEKNFMEYIPEVAERGARPALPTNKGVPKNIIKLLEQCWHSDPTSRPTASAIVQELTDTLEALSHIDNVKKPHTRSLLSKIGAALLRRNTKVYVECSDS